MPSSPDHYFLGFPVQAGGTETEGGAGSTTSDTANAIAVDVLHHAPSVGDILTAYSIGGRWVAEYGALGGSSGLACSPCTLPRTNLTVSWVNPIAGNGSTTLVYTSDDGVSWQSACSLGLLYQLYCNSSQIEFRVVYFVTGSCPTGRSAYCSNLQSAPLRLTLVSYTCSPFSLTFQTTSSSCPALVNGGFETFDVTL